MEWAKLLSTEKLSSEPPEPDSFKEYPINAFEKDYSRIVSSAAFRRLPRIKRRCFLWTRVISSEPA